MSPTRLRDVAIACLLTGISLTGLFLMAEPTVEAQLNSNRSGVTRILCQVTTIVDAAVQNQWNTGVCALPANTLSKTGDTVRYEAAILTTGGTTRAFQIWGVNTVGDCGGTNANLCTSGTNLTAATVTTTNLGAPASFSGSLLRSGASTQLSFATLMVSAALQSQSIQPTTLTETSTISLVVGERNQTTSASSVSQLAFTAWYTGR